MAIAAACGGGFLAFLDTTIVNVSFPSIAASFPEASRSELSWILDGYFIILAALLIPAGAVADRYGRKRVFLLGVAGFVVTSVACAIAPTWEFLVGARVLQGAAAAVVAPVSLALILPEFPLTRRATGVGIWGAAAGLAAAFGPPLGGVLVELSDWRLIFLVNLPLGAAVVWLGARSLLESRDETALRLPDLGGAALAVGSLGLLALGIVEGESWGWGSAGVLGVLAGGVVLLGWLVARCMSHPRPLVDPELFRLRSFRIGNLGTLLFGMAFFSTLLGNILFLTGVWGYSVLSAGLATIPGPFTSALVAGPAGRLADRFGHRAVIVPGCLTFAAGLLVLRSAGAQPDWLGTWLPGSILTGTGIGLAFPTLGSASVAEVAADRYGSASAVSSAFRQFGAVLGTALLVAIVGEPATLGAALDASDSAYLFSIAAAVIAGVVSLGLSTTRVPDTAPEPATV